MSDDAWVPLDVEHVDEVLLASKNGQPGEHPWLIDAADLLAEPDPGPTPWLVEDLVVEGAIVAAVGRWKTTKSYGLLDLCLSIASGQPAFGHAIPEPGPVVFANEESGRAALWRRLDSLCRGRALDPERLRGKLLLGANARIRLDDQGWQDELVQLGLDVRPRLYVFDPLARFKAAAREENAQGDMAVLIDYLRLLRQETGAAVCFVHHTGHQGDNMRGSSDLESIWETRLTWKRDAASSTVTVTSEHREAEAAEPVTYKIGWEGDTRTMRLDVVLPDGKPTLGDRILAALVVKGDDGMTTDQLRESVEVRRTDVVRTLETMETAGTAYRAPSHYRDARGRARVRTVWKPSDHAPLHLPGTTSQPPDGLSLGVDSPSERPTTSSGARTDGVSDDLPAAADDDEGGDESWRPF